jgi:T-complex protein 1 subunit eta
MSCPSFESVRLLSLLKFFCRYFADRDIFCAGRVSSDDLDRVIQAVGGSIQSTCSDIKPEHLGTCEIFSERQIGGERFNFFEGCPQAKTCTLVLRGGAEQFIAEVERSLHDAIMIVKRAIKNNSIVAGGGACEVFYYSQEISKTPSTIDPLQWRLPRLY